MSTPKIIYFYVFYALRLTLLYDIKNQQRNKRGDKMKHARKIGQGFYTYKGYTIYKDYSFPELDWRIYDTQGQWVDSLATKSDCMKLVDKSALMKID